MTHRPRTPASLVVAAFVMTMSSSPGQTYCIAIFAPWMKSELCLTDGGFGGFYTVATLASACVLTTPAMIEKAMASGMRARATTSPARMSPRMLPNHSVRGFDKKIDIRNTISDRFARSSGMIE